MKVVVYNEKEIAKEEPLRLKLLSGSGGEVTVVAVDADGTRKSQGCLVTFKADGTLFTEPCVGRYLGFQLDSQGRIKTSAL